MKESDHVTLKDVLLGRGGKINTHLGNRQFRSLVTSHQYSYLLAKKNEKAFIAKQIVEIVHSNGGRFLRPEGDDWAPVPIQRAISKTSQALREGLDVKNKTIRPDKTFQHHKIDEGEDLVGSKQNSLNVQGRVIAHVAVPICKANSIPDLHAEQELVQKSNRAPVVTNHIFNKMCI
jgi:hypothetical protein